MGRERGEEMEDKGKIREKEKKGYEWRDKK